MDTGNSTASLPNVAQLNTLQPFSPISFLVSTPEYCESAFLSEILAVDRIKTTVVMRSESALSQLQEGDQGFTLAYCRHAILKRTQNYTQDTLKGT